MVAPPVWSVRSPDLLGWRRLLLGPGGFPWRAARGAVIFRAVAGPNVQDLWYEQFTAGVGKESGRWGKVCSLEVITIRESVSVVDPHVPLGTLLFVTMRAA
jgi:hypothetical protein